jgi:hypothetical protein
MIPKARALIVNVFAVAGIVLTLTSDSQASSASDKAEIAARFPSEELSDHVREIGSSDIAVLTPEDASTRYFVNRRGGLRPPNYGGLIRASV